MAKYPEVIKVQSHFMVQLYLDATRLRLGRVPDLTFVDSDSRQHTGLRALTF
jgi:hypothetical protein